MPVDINKLTEGWLELESDPGLFTLLLEDFGVKGVQVEEIYDLQKPLEGPVYGFIFLFRWIEERRARRKLSDENESFLRDDSIVNSIFFAQQMVPNSCATHALLSVLLNCSNIHLGTTLNRLKAHTAGMNPENKGWGIGNTPELARAHNSHAMPQARRKQVGIVGTGRTGEAFHFVSYVPIKGKLFELDGLKPFPIDHGPWGEQEDWTEKFRGVITERLGIATGGAPYHDIRFNLMTVVPDRRIALKQKLKILKTNRQIVLEALQQLVKLTLPELTLDHSPETKETGQVIQQGIVSVTSNESRIQLLPKSPLSPTASCLPILETHNYCKKMDEHSVSSIPESRSIIKKFEESKCVRKDLLSPPDYSRPLMIQTSPAPSSSSTDTSSEIGSAFNSPANSWTSGTTYETSPLSTRDIKKLVVIRVSGEPVVRPQFQGKEQVAEGASKSDKSEGLAQDKLVVKRQNNINIIQEVHDNKRTYCEADMEHTMETLHYSEQVVSLIPKPTSDVTSGEVSRTKEHWICKYPELFQPHNFAPKDLLALLKNLEGEIALCESGIHDETEKRKKYKVDDCRRTHNYAEFICTFLSMLAQQGKFADLVKQHLSHNRVHRGNGNRNNSTGNFTTLATRPSGKTDTRSSVSHRKRGRPARKRK